MKYLAHRDEASGREQSLKEHLENTAELSGNFAQKFGAYRWGYCAGMLHDIGKYSQKFQRRLWGSTEKTDHATAGAQVCWKRPNGYQFLSYCIAGHHSGLPNTGNKNDAGSDSSIYGRMKKKVEDYVDYENEIKIPELGVPPFARTKEDNLGFFASMLMRMLYSCLVDADFLDTESFMEEENRKRDGGETISVLHNRLMKHISNWLQNNDIDTINGRRSEILRNCLKMGKNSQGIFRLTVPTGGGKTVASLAFALEHARNYGLDRIIYVIPYTSIIEQNAKVFADILGDSNVLEHHSNVDYPDTEEWKQMQLATENWDKPVVVTTNVQFFESLFSNRPSKCRKLHNISNSVIIFDEVQMLPSDYLKPCLMVMEQLVRHYNSTIVLCTATQPALDPLFSEDIKIQELCPRMEEQFRFFKRTQLENLGDISEDELVYNLRKSACVLCMLNTKKSAQRIYQKLEGEGVYHLSTAMYPIHRKRILAEINERLKKHQKCVVISTSLVEAGVDLDFAAVYRQVAGADSIIQAAGRCNREGRRDYSDSVTYVFRLTEREYMPGQRQQMEVTEALLEDGRKLDDLDTIHEYFKNLLYLRRENLDKKGILDFFQPGHFEFAEAAKKFKLIEQDTVTILIPKEQRGKEIYEEIRQKGPNRKLMREVGQYSVAVYSSAADKMYGAGMITPFSQELKDFYVLTDEESYNEKVGLKLNVGYGEAVLW